MRGIAHLPGGFRDHPHLARAGQRVEALGLQLAGGKVELLGVSLASPGRMNPPQKPVESTRPPRSRIWRTALMSGRLAGKRLGKDDHRIGAGGGGQFAERPLPALDG
jgi:hypothetical protein